MDEANYLRDSAKEGEESLAGKIYTNAWRRVKARFTDKYGAVSGISILASSKAHKAAFTERFLAQPEVKKDINSGNTVVFSHALWDAKPVAGPRFRVEIGDRLFPHRILGEHDLARSSAEIINVPETYRTDFIQDIDKALRDLAGIATDGMSPLFRDRQALDAAFKAKHPHPFSKDQIQIRTDDDITIGSYFLIDKMFKVEGGNYKLRLNPKSPRYVHIDIGVVKDAMGISMVHCAGMVTRKRTRQDGTTYEDKAPTYVADFVLRIIPSQGTEIDISKARDFLFYLRDLGVPIKIVTYDGWQSRGSVQDLRKSGFNAYEHSIDLTDVPYLTLRSIIMDGRFSCYPYPQLQMELLELERDMDKGKVNHPIVSPSTGKPGMKDCADATTGGIIACHNDPSSVPVTFSPPADMLQDSSVPPEQDIWATL